jgi:hypothetical protein
MAVPSNSSATVSAFGLDPTTSAAGSSSASNRSSGGQGPSVRSRSMSDIKHRLLQPATTSHFICKFQPPSGLAGFAGKKAGEGLAAVKYDGINADLIELLCSEASLPGSSYSTHSVENDFPGVSQKYAYRRMFDERASFTFYVDTSYTPIKFFEGWMAYIGNELMAEGQDSGEYFYRMNYPKGDTGYISDRIFIRKFEKNTGTKGATQPLEYVLIDAFPIAMNAIPVTYGQSEILKVSVSFSFSRYFTRIANAGSDSVSKDGRNPGNPEAKKTARQEFASYGSPEGARAAAATSQDNSKYDLNFDAPLTGNERSTSYSGATSGDFELSKR